MKASILAFAAACLFANGQPVRSSTDLPFTMSWSRGACSRCLLDGALEYIQFVTRSEVWGVSHAWPPPGTEGVGDYVAVHSQDGGRTWTEIRYTQTHAAAPSVFFADPENGWLVWLEVHPAGEIKMQRTRDGGRTWQQVSSGIDRFPELRDETHWYAIDGDKFLRTDDGGRTWRETRIPGMQYGGIHFLSNDVGWIANGTLEGRATVFRTVDGGDTWNE